MERGWVWFDEKGRKERRVLSVGRRERRSNMGRMVREE